MPGKTIAGILPLMLVASLLPAGCAPDENGAVFTDGEEVEGPPRPPRGIAWVVFGQDTVHAEIAHTSDQRAQGLMYREELPDGEGMIFVFDDLAQRSFWMQNTYIPLDIAFLDEHHRIVDIQQMEPETTEMTDSAAPAMFAIEVPQGWFEARGIGVGDTAHIVFGPF
jgi:uncharacterized protein